MADRPTPSVPDDEPDGPAAHRAPVVTGHTRSKERTLSPDVARGLMLLGIALANGATAWLAFGSDLLPTPPVSTTDTVVDVILGIFGNSRGLPMFALLFGFGIGMLAVREWKRGTPWKSARKLMFRRYWALVLFGALHMVFLFFGDILLMYAIYGLVAAFMVPWRDKTLLWFAGLLFSIYVLFQLGSFALMAVSGEFAVDAAAGAPGAEGFAEGENILLSMFGAEALQGTYLAQILTGLVILVSTPIAVIFGAPQLFSLVLVGIVVARRGILTDAENHLKLLRIVAVVGLSAAVLTGVPAGLESAGVLNTEIWATLSQIAGNLAGPGIIAAIALALRGLQQKQKATADAGVDAPTMPMPLEALKALGQRSMSGYLMQSVLFIVLVSGWGFDVFDGASVTAIAGWSALIWLVTVFFAYGLEVAGKPGPAEKLHRRMTYGAADSRAL